MKTTKTIKKIDHDLWLDFVYACKKNGQEVGNQINKLLKKFLRSDSIKKAEDKPKKDCAVGKKDGEKQVK